MPACCYPIKMQLSLLSSITDSVSDEPLDAWVQSQSPALRQDSRERYQAIWRSFASFANLHGRALASIDVAFLELFLEEIEPRTGAGTDISPQYAWRVLDLIHKVMSHLALQAREGPNMAAAQLLGSDRFKYANARHNEPLSEALEAAVAARLVKQLTADAESLGLKPTWKLERDRTALALMLGSGLTPAEVRGLLLSDLSLRAVRGAQMPWKIRVSGTAKTLAHDAPIAHWARRSLQRWLKTREDFGLDHETVFPATMNRAQWTDVGCQTSCTNTLTLLLGDEYRYGGLMRLRHTFVVRQLHRGITLEKIAFWLGLKSIDRLERYKRIMVREEFVV